ncbi:hypothetical protein DCS_05041 [Drechmeria coniospora]|uniref:AMP-activated protein kinase glycogen-binding domain-containing protein n=1 Tax=Drechmeria coniospora TaxID=98403 RepID=A0A151GLR5_DRECN|nr:hypothetical protein DCS_05041 [Drechmeria coniospora]KYK58028.1 hypothetical protein DCS_05041 [Drechmeria coniospora]
MGSYTFKWEHPADEAFVTGTFDEWRKTVKLDKEGGIFEKTIELPDAPDKIYFKFVVDGSWTINQSAPHEPDKDGNVNNYLCQSDLVSSATTVAMAKKNNNKKKQQQQKQQAAAAVAATTAAAETPLRSDTATPSDVPGGFPVTPANEEDKTVSVNPLPAAAGAVNPISLKPGEKVPKSVTAQDVKEHVKLDKESYEKSDALPAAVQAELPPVSKNMIPESSLPMGNGNDVTINSVGAGATTAALAGKVPLEPKVPAVVKESQEKAGFPPEASAVAAEVQDKAMVEEELKYKVKEVPATSVGVSADKTDKVAAAADAAGNKVSDATEKTKEKALEKVSPEAKESVAKAEAAVANGADAAAAEPTKNGTAVPAADSAESKAAESASKSASSINTDKKKKGRLSSLISKLKEKLSDKK